MIDLNIQKWVFTRGNYQIVIENAWHMRRGGFGLYSQERITVNGDRVRDKIETPFIILFWRTVFQDTLIDAKGEVDLKVQWRSAVNTVKSRLLIDGQHEDWTDYQEIKWTGEKGDWPDFIDYETAR